MTGSGCHSTQSASQCHWVRGTDFALFIHEERVNKLVVSHNFNFAECLVHPLNFDIHTTAGVGEGVGGVSLALVQHAW